MLSFFNPIRYDNGFIEWNMTWDANHIVMVMPNIETTFDRHTMGNYRVTDFLQALEVCNTVNR